MRWSTVSGPLLCLSSALALLHAIANALDVGSQSNSKSRSGAERATRAEAAVALGLEDFSPDTIMDPLGHAPVYSSPNNKPARHNTQSNGDTSNGNNIIDSITDNNNIDINSSDREAPLQSATSDFRGGPLADDRIAKAQQWLNSPRPPRKQTRRPPNPDGRGGTAPRHDVNQDPCARVGSGLEGGPISYDLIKACLDSDFGFQAEVRQDTVDTVKSLISSFYVFEDLAAHPPRDESVQHLSFQPVELIKEIDAWVEQSKVSATAMDDKQEAKDDDVDTKILEAQRAWGGIHTKMTDREFHDGISRILLKARDGHLSYDADCFRAFRFQHGFFMSHVVRDGRPVIKVHSVAPYFPYQNGVKEDILNCDVLAVDGRDAVDYIQDWADRHISMSKDGNVRFNAALATPQYRSGTADFFLPGKFSERFTLPTEKSLSFSFRCPSNRNLTLNVRWVGFYTHEQSKPFTNAESYFTSNCIKDAADLYGYEDDDEGQGRDRSKLEKEKQEDSEKKDISELKSSLRELLMQSATPAPSPSDSKIAGPLLDFLPLEPHPPVTDGVATPTLPLTSAEKDLSKHVDEIVSKLDMISSERLPVVKFYDDYGGRVSEMSRAMGALPFKELYQGKHGISALMLNDGKTGVITVRTESSTIRGEAYSRVHPAWAGSLLQAINVLRPKAENLILDLSHNTGGYVCLGVTMVQIFFPERPRLVTNIRLSPLSTQMMTAGAMGIDHFISPYGESPVAAFQSGYFLKPTTHPHRNFTFSDYLSDRCAIADKYTLAYDPVEESRRKRASSTYGTTTEGNDDDSPYRPWDPENLAILTDGYCGSSCALISNMMHTKFGVPTVVVGGRTTAQRGGSMSYSTFPGLQVVDDALLFTEMHDVRSGMMSVEEVHKLEDGGRRRKFQAAFAAENKARSQDGDDDDDDDSYEDNDVDSDEVEEDEDDVEDEQAGQQSEEEDEAEEDEDGDYDTFYPLTFAQKGRLRLTWRQIYNTGPELEVFKLKTDGVNDLYEPAWKATEQWHEYSFIPADHRIDYTDHNVHSIGAIWEDARDALWDNFSSRGGSDVEGDEDAVEGVGAGEAGQSQD
ncbi:hypothetical protein EC957_010448 [Mortierella hygrophila]|uniref:Tail specific protease domain-containing protein n=1 Tax=Mortierella hygrophila TaxID=979708 RepID=A0A9P6F9U9_9FUNG|nr:hypothetical protein EC957_010448 [Mortierella hygrophila]